MEICASVLTNTDYTEFHLKCMYCSIESELKDWEQFVKHTRSAHLFNDADEESTQSAQNFEAYITDSSLVDIKEEHEQWPEDDIKCEIRDDFLESMEAGAIQSTTEKEAYNEIFTILEDGETHISSDESENRAIQTCTEDDNVTDDIDYIDKELNISSDSEEEPEANPPKRPRTLSKPLMRKLKVSFIRQNPRVLHFIEEIRKHPCLWNPNDLTFGDEKSITEAYNSIIEVMDKKADVLFTEIELKKSIQQLFQQFALASRTEQLTGMPAHYLKKCKFLSVTNSQTQSEDDEDDESAKTDIIQLNFKEINYMTTTFIETYEKFPELYDSSATEFKSIEARTQAYIKIAKLLAPKIRVNETEVHLAVMKLRKWVYMTLRRVKSKELRRACSKSELHYVAMCSFLPPKSECFVINCEICDKRFFIDYSLRAHMVKAHNVGEMPYLCSQCPRRFEKHHDMERHKLRQHCEKLLKCKFCDSSFSLKTDLQVHLRVHTGEKPYVCEMCGKSFRLKLLLDYHINGFHLNLRPFKCDLCPKTYRKRVQLKNHMKGHLNIKDKKCVDCGSAFTCPTSLSRHRRFCLSKKNNLNNDILI